MKETINRAIALIYDGVQKIKMRKVLKEDDGFLDVIVKLLTIAAFIVASHQYYYKVYPVWNKEKKLSAVTKSLEEKERLVSAQQRILESTKEKVTNAEQQIVNLNNEVSNLTDEKENIERLHREKIAKLTKNAESLKNKFEEERAKLSSRLNSAKNTINSKNSEMINVYLSKFSHDVFLVQIDSIRWSKDKNKLDLKREILAYVEEEKENEKSKIKLAALQIFKLYANKALAPGIKEYSEALGVTLFSLRDEESRTIIKMLNNT